MTPAEVAATLRQFNGWRRDFEDKFEQPDPREIGEAIDAAIEMIERNGNAKVLGVYRCPYCSGWHLTRQVGAYAVTSADPIVPVSKVRKKL